MTDDLTTDAYDPEHRARVVAGIRALADLIETRADLPVPNSISAQHSILGDIDASGIALVRRTAIALDVKPEIEEHRASAYATVAGGSMPDPYFRVTYTVHGNRPEPGQEEAS